MNQKNTRIDDLKIDDVIRFQENNKDFSFDTKAIVDNVRGHNDLTGKGIYFYAVVTTEDGRTLSINDNWDFCKVNEPFTRKVDVKQEEQDMVYQPSHYQFGSFSANVIIELVGKTYKSASVFYHVGNALKYLMRAPRKNGLEDLKKAKQSVDFAIECWE